MMMTTTSLVVGSLCLFLGCDDRVEFSSDSEEVTIQATAHYIEASDDEPERVAAVVNERQISHADVERSLDRLSELYRHTRQPFDDSIRDRKRREVIERLIDRELLRDHISRSDIEIPSEQVDQEMERRIETRFGSAPAFHRYLEAENQSEADFRLQIREELALETLILGETSEEIVDEETLRKHYDRIAKRRPAGQRVHASTLSVRLPRGADELTRERIRTSLQNSLERIEEPDDFGKLSHKIGQGPNTFKLDQLRWIERHQVHPAAAEVLFEESGEEGLTPIIDTPFGFEVYWVHEHRPPGVRGFDEVEELLRHRARLSRIEESRRHLLQQLRNEATISIEREDAQPPPPQE